MTLYVKVGWEKIVRRVISIKKFNNNKTNFNKT